MRNSLFLPSSISLRFGTALPAGKVTQLKPQMDNMSRHGILAKIYGNTNTIYFIRSQTSKQQKCHVKEQAAERQRNEHRPDGM